MLVSILLLLVSLVMLTAGAELLVRGAVGLARAAGVSSLLTGLTIVAFGTSTPELATSLRATVTGHPDVAIGNAIGSNLFNLGVILGIAALVCPIPVHRRVIMDGAVPMVLAAFVPLLALTTGGVITRWQGVLMLGLLLAYIGVAYVKGREDPQQTATDIESIPIAGRGRKQVWLNLLLVAVGLGLLVGATPLLVGSAVDIARTAGVPELVIALTVVAGGTSAPELVTSLIAAIRGQSDVAIGNVLGSNVFNILGIVGACAIVEGQVLPRQTVVLDVPFMIVLSVASVPLMRSGGRVSRVEGAVLLAAWAAYAAFLFLVGPGIFE